MGAPCAGDLACNPDMCPDWESNQQPFGSQAHAQSTELHQPGHAFLIGIYSGSFYLVDSFNTECISRSLSTILFFLNRWHYIVYVIENNETEKQ